MGGETQAGQLVEKATAVVKESPGFLMSILKTPFNVVGGLGKGVWDATVGNLSGLLMTFAGFAGITYVAPELVKWLPFKVKGKKIGETLGEKLEEGGDSEWLKQSALAALAVNGVIGGVKGTLGGVSESVSGESTSVMNKTMGFIGGGAVAVAIGALAMNAIKKNDIGYAGNSDVATNKQPNIAPAPTNNQEVSAPKV
jgi:hypothetical protein